MTAREEQREKRKREILEAGLDLFIRKGYASTKISDIAERVGMSIGLLFHYFKSKEQLYETLIQLGIHGPMSVFEPIEKEPLAFFEDTAKLLFQYIRTKPFISKMFVLMSQAYYNESAPQSVKDMLKGFDIYKPTVLLIEKGQANGTIREGDPLALAAAYWCAIQGIAEMIAIHPDIPCPEGEWIADVLRKK